MKDISKLQFHENEYFGNSVLDLFGNKRQLSIIYGANGSGKTTISNTIEEIKQSNDNSSFYDFDGRVVNLDENDKNHIFVFNENYIDSKLRVTTDGISAILLFGESANIDEKIDAQKAIIKKENDDIKNRNIDKYFTLGSAECINDIETKIIERLKSTWAERQMRIRKGEKRSPVNAKIVEEIKCISTSKHKRAEVSKKLDELILNLSNSSPNGEILPLFDNMIAPEFNESHYISLLNQKLDKKILGELANKILENYRNKGNISETRQVISGSIEICPTCLQPVSQDWRKQLNNAINEVFDDTINDYSKKLSEFVFDEVDINFSGISSFVEPSLIEEYNAKKEKYNDIIKIYDSYKKEKQSNIYDPLNVSSLELSKFKEQLSIVIDKINSSIESHNETIKNYNKTIEEASRLNVILSAFETSDLFVILSKLSKDKNEILKQNEESKQKIDNANKLISDLSLKKKNYNIAKEEINKELSLMFSSTKRLYLGNGEDSSRYYIYSKGKKVKNKKLSTGERNVIALAYFFEQIKNECQKGEYFKEPLFIVIDDPISSFDFENKLAVFSYIDLMMKRIFNGNEKTQAILMTHERNVAYSLWRALEKIRLDNGKKLELGTFGLRNKKIDNLNFEKRSNYYSLAKEVFEFANSESSEDLESKGNVIRKFFESYTTFNYNCGIDAIFSKKEVTSIIKSKELKEYFETRLSHLVMNQQSHTMIQTLEFPDLDTFDMFSIEEQIKSAKDILCFLYCVHESHIKSMFESSEIKTIELWLKEIEKLLIE